MAATVPEAVHALLAADATLLATATGGVYVDVGSSDKHPLDRQVAPGAYSEVGSSSVYRLLPCVLVTQSSRAPEGPGGKGRVHVVRVGAYDDIGYLATQSMLDRVHAVLHNRWVQLDSGQRFLCRWLDDVFTGSEDPDLSTGGTGRAASYEAARYTCHLGWADSTQEERQS